MEVCNLTSAVHAVYRVSRSVVALVSRIRMQTLFCDILSFFGGNKELIRGKFYFNAGQDVYSLIGIKDNIVN